MVSSLAPHGAMNISTRSISRISKISLRAMRNKNFHLFSEYTFFHSIAPNVGDLAPLKYFGHIGEIEQNCRSSARLAHHAELDRRFDVENMYALFLQMIEQEIRLFLADDHHDFLWLVSQFKGARGMNVAMLIVAFSGSHNGCSAQSQITDGKQWSTAIDLCPQR